MTPIEAEPTESNGNGLPGVAEEMTSTTSPPQDDPALRPLPSNALVFEAGFNTSDDIPVCIVVTTGSGEVEEHVFTAVGDPGAGGLLAVSGLVRYDPKGRQLVDLNAIMTFFGRVLVEGDLARLDELLSRQDVTIEFDVLGNIFNALIERYTGRPMQPPSSSANRRRFTGR